MAIVRYTAEEALKLKTETDFERVDALTDEEVEQAAKSDPDSFWPTPEQLKQFKRKKALGKKNDHKRSGKKSG
jgi:hypothetical protein